MSMGGRSLRMGPAALVAALGIEIARKKALLGAATELQAAWQEILNVPGTGAPRRLGGQASKPGEAPAPDEGNLRDSIAVVPQADGTIRVGTGLDYGRLLEWGTDKIEPRPHARPAKDQAWADMKDVVKVTLSGKRG